MPTPLPQIAKISTFYAEKGDSRNLRQFSEQALAGITVLRRTNH